MAGERMNQIRKTHRSRPGTSSWSRIARTTYTGGCITLESVLGDNPGRAGRTARVCETRLKLTRGDTITRRRRRLSSYRFAVTAPHEAFEVIKRVQNMGECNTNDAYANTSYEWHGWCWA